MGAKGTDYRETAELDDETAAEIINILDALAAVAAADRA